MAWLSSLSRGVLQVEKTLSGTLIAVIFLTMTAGALGRSFGHPVLWADELAVHLMVCIAFIGASMGVALRNHMAIGVLPESLGARGRIRLSLLTGLLVLAFLGVMLSLCWRWFDLPGLIRTGSGRALAAETFNFVHVDPTMTIGLRKIWFWSVVPLSTLTAMIHTLAQLAEDLAGLRSEAA